MTITDEYEYEYEHAGETIQVGIQCGGVTHEPRVRWRVGMQRGERGYVYSDAVESVIKLEGTRTAWIQDERTAAIPVPRSIAEALADDIKQLGTIGEDGRVSTDPAAFPAEIDGFERVGWEMSRNVMWYWCDDHADPRAYQIEDGTLMFRAQEWADLDEPSKRDLIDHYDLTTTWGESSVCWE